MASNILLAVRLAPSNPTPSPQHNLFPAPRRRQFCAQRPRLGGSCGGSGDQTDRSAMVQDAAVQVRPAVALARGVDVRAVDDDALCQRLALQIPDKVVSVPDEVGWEARGKRAHDSRSPQQGLCAGRVPDDHVVLPQSEPAHVPHPLRFVALCGTRDQSKGGIIASKKRRVPHAPLRRTLVFKSYTCGIGTIVKL